LVYELEQSHQPLLKVVSLLHKVRGGHVGHGTTPRAIFVADVDLPTPPLWLVRTNVGVVIEASWRRYPSRRESAKTFSPQSGFRQSYKYSKDSAERTQYDPKNVGHRGSKWYNTGSNFRQNDLFSVESVKIKCRKSVVLLRIWDKTALFALILRCFND
jgi:hypothetical protein